MPSLVEIVKWFWRKGGTCKKFTDGQAEGRQTKSNQISSLELGGGTPLTYTCI